MPNEYECCDYRGDGNSLHSPDCPVHGRLGGSTRQPPPTPNDGPSIHDLVVRDLAGRKALGLARYGTVLQARNGRDALSDAYDELLDGACYLRQVIAERDASEGGYLDWSSRPPSAMAEIEDPYYVRWSGGGHGEDGRMVMTSGRPGPAQGDDNDDNQRPRWTVRRSIAQTIFRRDGREVGKARRARDGSGWYAIAGERRLVALVERDAAEAWICEKTGHPGTHDPPRRVGDCRGAAVQHCGHLTSAIVSSGEGLQATNYCGACAAEDDQ